MSKKDDETSLEYKKRVMDKISPSFCAAKWYNATIWLDWGQTTSCHHPDSHDIIIKDIIKDPAALHSTKEKKEARRQMLKGERPSGCEYCWTFEDMGEENVSDRVFKTNIYDEQSIEKIAKGDPDENIDLKTLEVSFSRKCNFACSYCGPNFSTRWAADVKKDGAYQNLKDPHGGIWESPYDHQYPYEDSPINPYVIAFWKWWPRLAKSLQELRVTGGEPLLSQDFWELIRFVEKSKREDMHFSVNSNLGLGSNYIDRLVESSHKINNFHLYTSCESKGERAEYIRDGLDYELFHQNLEKAAKDGNFQSINMMMTINALCLFGLPEFLDQIFAWKKKFGTHFPTFTMNMLRFPSFMSALTLPDHIKDEVKHNLNDWYQKHKTHSLMLPHERDSIERLINYLHRAETPHKRASSREVAQRDFKVFFDQYDKRRDKSITETFPKEFAQWYHTIRVDN